MNPVLVYCNIEDVQLDADGCIHFYIRKDKKITSIETVKKIREMKGIDCSITISPMRE